MQVVVITGLAQGIGRELAKLMAASGNVVTGFDVDADGIASLKSELDQTGGQHLLQMMNICDRPGILGFKDEVLRTFGHADTVVSNVGIGFFGPFEEVDLEAAAKCMEINVIGTAAIFQAFVPSMRERRRGKLIAVSSLVGQIPFPFESVYSASKFAVEGLVQSMRYEVEPFGLRVALVQPAQVTTEFAAKVHKLPPEGSPYRERVRRFISRDEELIKAAPTPSQAAAKIVEIIESERPAIHNPIDFKSRFFMRLNRFLPTALRDRILLDRMDIRV
jgi:short-subunit dehydrogenase